MSYQTLAFEKKEGVGIVSIFDLDNQTKVSRLANELTELCTEIAWDKEIRVVLVIGAGENSFLIETTCVEEQYVAGRSIADPVSKLSQPVIVALNGDVMGPGLELALACDVRIASEGSRFGLRQIQSGIIPFEGGTQRLSRLVGKGKALEMILTGEVIDTREAFRVGLVSKVVSLDQLMVISMSMAEEMASKAPIALQYAKEAVYEGMELTLEQGLRLEADLYFLLHTTRDREVGIRAFREKKVPKFEGK